MKGALAGARAVGRRILVEGRLALSSPCHLGGSDADATSDQPLVRDAAGRPYLPGTTLCGLLRGTLREAGRDPRDLFGSEADDDPASAQQARLLVADAPVALLGPLATELRDGVAIVAARGVADDGKKYDVELLPAGTSFSVRLELLLPSGDPAPLRADLLVLLARLEAGEVRLGARTRRGFGRARAVPDDGARWRVETYDVTERAGLLAWLGRGLPGLPPDWPAGDRQSFAGVGDLAAHWGQPAPAPHTSPCFTVHLWLRFDGPFIVRSGGNDPDEADGASLRRLRVGLAPEAVLPGTSLAGVLRHRCLRIARTLARDEQRAAELVGGMFGAVAHASRVEVTEAVVRHEHVLRHTRVRIDPWTGGAADKLMFTEDVVFGGDVEGLEIGLRETRGADDPRRTGAERALLLLALRDLASGELAVGGEGSVGRGRLRPRGEERPFAAVERTSGGPVQLTLRADGTAQSAPERAFEEDFAGLRAWLEVSA
jgi:CRISPR/Cas system CSM-associated protein Csm3 (group 7 of RAMP superfamily)